MEPLSEQEMSTLRLAEAQERVTALSDRIERLKAEGSSTVLYEQLLRTLQSSLHLMQAHVRRLANVSISYRCYLMRGERIHGVQIIGAPDDAEVLIKAGALLKEHPEHPTIEVWEGKRLVARLARSPS